MQSVWFELRAETSQANYFTICTESSSGHYSSGAFPGKLLVKKCNPTCFSQLLLLCVGRGHDQTSPWELHEMRSLDPPTQGFYCKNSRTNLLQSLRNRVRGVDRIGFSMSRVVLETPAS
ncbi:hypothetical protein VNO77_19344 [Canavalia gladiata]|uniref:Uncharacterized protein n=1 Tax=Canavalia gladiata TaxID=3824 RepID=A0AAN9LMB6_CANGL